MKKKQLVIATMVIVILLGLPAIAGATSTGSLPGKHH